MTIKVDIDGVLRDFVESLNQEYDRTFQARKWRTVVNGWDIGGHYQIGQDIYKFAFHTHAENIFLKKALPHYDNIASLALFVEAHPLINIVLVTAVHSANLVDYTMKWVEKVDLGSISIRFEPMKTKIEGDILIDDKFENLMDSAAAGELPIAISHPWNQTWAGRRADTLDEALEIAVNYFTVQTRITQAYERNHIKE